MVEDLSAYSIGEVDASVKAYRRGVENRFFPTSGQLIAPILAARTERARDAKISTKPIQESRPLMWWMQSRQLWKPGWREADAPEGAMVRDEVSGNWRKARVFA